MKPEPIATATGYVGVDVHRAARLCSAGYGGQILLSETTRQLVTDNLPEDPKLGFPEHLGEVVDLHADAQVRLVGSVPGNRLRVRHPPHRQRDVPAHGPEDLPHQRLDESVNALRPGE